MKNLTLFVLLLFYGCQSSEKSDAVKTALPAAEQIQQRLSDTNKRLAASEGGQLIGAAIEAHGGLERWWANGPLHFRWTYHPLGKEKSESYQTVDFWASRAVHYFPEDRLTRFGWDGRQAWVQPPGAELDVNPRFYALTPYYFVGIPFVLADEGIRYELLEPDTLFEQQYDLVKITYGEGVGDAPDDYYVTYIHREHKRVDAIRYIVSYPAFFPDGGHSSVRLMTRLGEHEVEGIIFPDSFKTYQWDGSRGQQGANVRLDQLEYRPELADDYFYTPAGAEVVDGLK